MASLIVLALQAQDYRTIDGSMNNLQHPEWGAAHGGLQNITPVAFLDSISQPNGTDRANPRIISNTLFAQDGLINDPFNLSDYVWVFGQLLDHDITFVPSNPAERAQITVNFVDSIMNPTGIFPITIPMTRSRTLPGTGTDPSNPRRAVNIITAWIDGSCVYGSDDETADWFRTFSGGKIKVSSGNLLPYNTTNGERNAPIDHSTPEMENENPFIDHLFIAGDSRANENPSLLALHTLFHREHNRLCEELIVKYPDWSDEQLYQHARKMVGGQLQAITYNEWLPVLGIHLPPYAGYDPAINPNISNVFSAAAFRLGHTLLNSNILRMDNDGEIIPEGNLTLRDAFFNPEPIADTGLDPFLKGMAVQVMQEMDAKVIDDVRNFLFGPPGGGGGGLDLPAINIQRGRERGLADFNSIREHFGLTPHATHFDICQDSAVAAVLEELYPDINEIDAWVGMMIEEDMDGALFGETILAILKHQFSVLRSGDRFYFENDPMLAPEEIDEIRHTLFRDIIIRNSNITALQENVFIATPHDSVCAAVNVLEEINGIVTMESGLEIKNVNLEIEGSTNSRPATTDENGEYTFSQLKTCEEYTVTPQKEGDYRDGVTTFDLVLTTKHILGAQDLDSPYKLIAADVNNSGSITTFDVVQMRKLILAVEDEFPDSESWRFIDADYMFSDPTDPFAEPFREYAWVGSLSQAMQFDFVAVKMGDVNDSANPNTFQSSQDRWINEPLVFQAADQDFKAGELVEVVFRAPAMSQTLGYQYTLEYDSDKLDVEAIEPGQLRGLYKDNFAVHQDKGLITTSWNGQQILAPEVGLYTIAFRAKTNGKLSELISINSDLTKAEAYDLEFAHREVVLEFTATDKNLPLASDLILHQNRPNPFMGLTTISFVLPEACEASLVIYDLAGREIYVVSNDYPKGYNELDINSNMLPASGMLYYQLRTPFGTRSKLMTIAN
ncbi:MAG: peroxidase family protein [Bacteroidota bacterium]